MELYTNRKEFSAELLDVIKMFELSTEYLSVDDDNYDTNKCIHYENIDGDIVYNVVRFKGDEYKNEYILPHNMSLLIEKKLLKRYAKLAIYECMCRVYKKQLPWGALTGIRPTKVYYEFLENGIENPEEKMTEIFKVSSKKAELIKNIVQQQKGLINNENNKVNIYVGIPFCRTKCTYCTFTGGTIDQLKKYVRPYIDTLKQEIKNAFDIIEENNYTLDNVYFGGGTPTTLNADELEEIIELFDGKEIKEFTVEAGRPDTVSNEHFAVFDKHKIGRISINPQTFNDATLLRINRKHSSDDIISCYNNARKYNFIINMDLIAGLPGEDNTAFNYSLDKCLSLHPDNITVHTLALKRGSTLREQLYTSNNDVSVSNMVEYASKELMKNNYNPYYLYRQKYMSENLENVGYCLNGTQCRYNIDIMEERKSIIACGSNAISKRIFLNENRIERYADTKDIRLYIERGNNFDGKKLLFSK